MINASFTSILRISVKDRDHRSQPDVWGNNDRQHRINPLNQDLILALVIDIMINSELSFWNPDKLIYIILCTRVLQYMLTQH